MDTLCVSKWLDGAELMHAEWRETVREMEAGGRTISAGTGALDRRRSAGCRSTLPFFLHNYAETYVERQVRKYSRRSA